MKALYPTISYTLFIVISVAVLSVLLISIRGFAEKTQSNYAQSQLEYAADILRNDMLSIYNSNSSGRLQTSMPEYITGKRYSVEIGNSTIELSLEANGRSIKATRRLDMAASMSGKSYAPITIEYRKDEGIFELVQ
jgi:hypothetical protein